MKHLEPIQVLTDDAIFLLERIKIHLQTYNDTIPTEATKKVIEELSELIDELKLL
jgi:hypothetical protein